MRERLTWRAGARHASAHPAYPDEGPAAPAYQPDPEADAYENGDPSSWAEDPHPGPYLQSAHPATPDEGPASPAYAGKAASLNVALERKAAKCIRLASSLLGPTASSREVEDQALAFMDLSDRALQASLSRIAEEQDPDQEAQQAPKAQQKAKAQAEKQEAQQSPKAQAKAKAAYLRRLAEQVEKEVEEKEEVEVDDEDEDEGEDQAKEGKKASALDARLARIERLLARTAQFQGMPEAQQAPVAQQSQQAQQHQEAQALLAQLVAEEQALEAQQLQQAQQQMMGQQAPVAQQQMMGQQQALAQMQQMVAQMPASAQQQMLAQQLQMMAQQAQQAPVAQQVQHAQQQQAQQHQQAQQMLAQMLAEEGMGEAQAAPLEAQYQDMGEAQMFGVESQQAQHAQQQQMGQQLQHAQQQAVAQMIAEESMVVDPGMMDSSLVEDPMGLMGVEGSEDMILAQLFGMKAAKKGQEQEAQEAQEQEAQEQEAQEKEGKKASLRPQPKKASTGATRLGGVTKEAAEINELSSLWESAPDVTKYF